MIEYWSAAAREEIAKQATKNPEPQSQERTVVFTSDLLN
jgi:hypothetical protein